ncbi:Spy/CpxP family protein refolding chaperone [Rheinheimera sp.]|uniref:Spy/CpxP family protein refolding chaperone n=1 Tax=Rheinheimera sp. TaxID=1869214 RepID=UPI002610207D|nr:Spy/CpxP family protein refolding chaperone [Rheinheimera sp.]MCA1930244.1 Spy/CpxP family protein refolding chaperone [Rheinheimera sp.]
MKYSTVIALVFSGLMATNSISSFAGPERGHEGHGPAMGFHLKALKGLDLSEAQKEQIKALMEQHRATMPKPDQVKPEMEQLKALVQAESFDEAAVRALLESKQKDKLDQDVARAKLQFEINKVLTTEQKAKLAERQQKWQEKAKARAEAKS